MIGMSQYLFFGLLVALLIVQFQPIVVLSVFAFRLIVQRLVYYKAMKLLSEKDLFVLAPFYELCMMVMYPVIKISNMTMRKNKWK
jgi:CBS domain containing-hemolysin-like protein